MKNDVIFHQADDQSITASWEWPRSPVSTNNQIHLRLTITGTTDQQVDMAGDIMLLRRDNPPCSP